MRAQGLGERVVVPVADIYEISPMGVPWLGETAC